MRLLLLQTSSIWILLRPLTRSLIIGYCKKISKHGSDGKMLTWISAWLSGRWQQVCVGGQYSSRRPVTSGVPQGSVLGPILFLIFINDLESGLTSSVFKFADDTKILGTVNTSEDKDILQQISSTWWTGSNSGRCSSTPPSVKSCILSRVRTIPNNASNIQ